MFKEQEFENWIEKFFVAVFFSDHSPNYFDFSISLLVLIKLLHFDTTCLSNLVSFLYSHIWNRLFQDCRSLGWSLMENMTALMHRHSQNKNVSSTKLTKLRTALQPSLFWYHPCLARVLKVDLKMLHWLGSRHLSYPPENCNTLYLEFFFSLKTWGKYVETPNCSLIDSVKIVQAFNFCWTQQYLLSRRLKWLKNRKKKNKSLYFLSFLSSLAWNSTKLT